MVLGACRCLSPALVFLWALYNNQSNHGKRNKRKPLHKHKHSKLLMANNTANISSNRARLLLTTQRHTHLNNNNRQRVMAHRAATLRLHTRHTRHTRHTQRDRVQGAVTHTAHTLVSALACTRKHTRPRPLVLVLRVVQVPPLVTMLRSLLCPRLHTTQRHNNSHSKRLR